MKKETTSTHYVPAHRATDGKFNAFINYFLPEEFVIVQIFIMLRLWL